MADEYILKSYDGGAETTTLTSPFTVSGTTLVVANGSTFPDGSSGPFVVVVDRGLATEEKFLIDTTTGTNGTTFNIQQAAYDGTSASAHAVGATVEHCLDAFSIEQANRYVNLQTARGDLITHNNTTTTKLAAGANNTVLMADSAQTVGLKYSTIGSTSITDGAVVKAKLASDSVDATKLENGAVIKDKLAAASVDSTKLDTASSGTTNQVLARNTSVASGIEWQTAAAGFTMPAGIVVPYAGASSPAGWLFCDGTAVSRTTYAALFSAIGTTYGSGNGSTTFTLPNTGSKFIAGKGSVAWSDALTDTGGSEIAVIVTHTHTFGHTHSGSTTLGEGAHTHLLDVDHNAAAYGSSGGIGITTSSPDATRTVASNNSAHQHSFATDAQSSTTVPAPSGATATSNTANLPPYLTMNYIIKT